MAPGGNVPNVSVTLGGKFVSWQRRLLVEGRLQGHPDVVPRQPYCAFAPDLQVPRPAGGVSRRATARAANPKPAHFSMVAGLPQVIDRLHHPNVKNGAEIAANICASCHGESGVSRLERIPIRQNHILRCGSNLDIRVEESHRGRCRCLPKGHRRFGEPFSVACF